MVCKRAATMVTMCAMKHIDPQSVIAALGGPVQTAKLCNIRSQAVSQWRKRGVIPAARLMYLRLLRPDVFQECSYDEKKAA